MKRLFLFLFCLTSIAAYAQDVVGNAILLGHTDSIRSIILNEKRTFWVRLPAGANNPNNAGLRYPVVYVLDGSEHFASVSGIIQYLSEANGNMICPDMIVVGINNTDRTRDLTQQTAILITKINQPVHSKHQAAAKSLQHLLKRS
jgi:predicted alpha/beta superfamily hydrolase